MGVFNTSSEVFAAGGGEGAGVSGIPGTEAPGSAARRQPNGFLLRSLPVPFGLVVFSGCLSSSLPPSFASGRSATSFSSGG